MKVFITGATGVLGRRVVKLLRAAGHEVAGLSRSEKNAQWLAAQGVEFRQGDLFDAAQMRRVTAGYEAILHLATAIPTKSKTTPADWALNDRIRGEGTANLVEAALHNGCKFYLQESITFIYGDRKGEWTDEGTPPAARLSPILQSAVEMEQIVQQGIAQRQLPAIILRFGMFYCHDSAQTQAMFEAAGKGLFPVVGAGENFWNIIQVDDAAAAVVRAVDAYPNGLGWVFNVCDDEPVRYRELVDFVARKLGARKPMSLPAFLARGMLGAHTTDFLLASARCKNQAIKDALGWKPGYSTYREGYAAEIERWRQEPGGK